MAIQLPQAIGRRITTITEDTCETTFLFQCLSNVHGSSKGKCGLLPKHRIKCCRKHLHLPHNFNIHVCRLCAGSHK